MPSSVGVIPSSTSALLATVKDNPADVKGDVGQGHGDKGLPAHPAKTVFIKRGARFRRRRPEKAIIPDIGGSPQVGGLTD